MHGRALASAGRLFGELWQVRCLVLYRAVSVLVAQRNRQIAGVPVGVVVGVVYGYEKFLRMERMAPRATTVMQIARRSPARMGATTTIMARP